MALRNIMQKGERCLEKRCREVEKFDSRLHELIDDMRETLISSGGVGLAAPQVGILKRVVLVVETNVEEDEEEFIIELVNPEILAKSGNQEGPEGCLSVPGVFGWVKRPDIVKVRAQDRNGESFEYIGKGLTARCIMHETDHLDGHLFLEKADHIMDDEELAKYYGQGEESEEE